MHVHVEIAVPISICHTLSECFRVVSVPQRDRLSDALSLGVGVNCLCVSCTVVYDLGVNERNRLVGFHERHTQYVGVPISVSVVNHDADKQHDFVRFPNGLRVRLHELIPL